MNFNMKNVLLMYLAGALLLLGACKNVDQVLVGKLQAEQAKIKENLPSIEANAQKAAALLKEMDAAPAALKIYPKLNFAEVYGNADAVNTKYTAILGILNGATAQLDSLMKNYADGPLKTEDVQAGLEVIGKDIENLPRFQDRVIPFMEKTSTDFNTLLAAWNALPESERQIKAGQIATPTDATNTLMPSSAISAPAGKTDAAIDKKQ